MDLDGAAALRFWLCHPQLQGSYRAAAGPEETGSSLVLTLTKVRGARCLQLLQNSLA